MSTHVIHFWRYYYFSICQKHLMLYNLFYTHFGSVFSGCCRVGRISGPRRLSLACWSFPLRLTMVNSICITSVLKLVYITPDAMITVVVVLTTQGKTSLDHLTSYSHGNNLSEHLWRFTLQFFHVTSKSFYSLDAS